MTKRIAERDRWLLAFAPSVGREAAARSGAALFVIAGVLGLFALAFPGGSGSSAVAGFATSFCACAFGGGLWFAGRHLSAVAYQVVAAVAAALASVSVYFGGSEGWLNGFFFFWIALFVAYFFTLPAVVLQTLVIGILYVPALALNGEIRHAALIWFLTTTTVGVTAAVVAILRERLERALLAEHREVEHLLELDRLKDDFIATVSHELRTPVTAVYGAAATLLRPGLPTHSREQLLRVCHQEALRLAELVERLLASAAVDRGQLSVELAAIDPALPTREAVEAARVRDSARAIKFDSHHAAASVMADPARLQQAVAALLDNALKYSPREMPIHVDVSQAEGRACISVSDYGRGIPPGEREYVFDKFHRLDPQMRNGVSGSGLGLHIVRGLIDAMNGRVWIEPTRPDGSGVTVIVELRSAEAAGTDQGSRGD
ncbi:MAG: HAMP domain-containing histidine kinase [Actinomycetota bacterium]|nr:HAMP domain-containing histidine kinase [Actinomycetota bacterium]